MKLSARMALVVGIIVATPCVALSGSDQGAVPVVYEADPDCPDAARFMVQLRARTPRARPALTGDVHPLRVWAHMQDGKASARVELTRPDGAVVVREVSSDTCEAVVTAIALTTSMMIDEEAAAAASAPSASAPSSAASACPKCPSCAAPSAPPAPSSPRSGWEFGTRVRFTGGLAPGILIGSEHFLQAPATTDAPLRRHFRASFLYVAAESGSHPAVARTQVYEGKLAACPLGVNPTPRLLFAACAEVGLGAISVRGQTSHPQSATRLWSDASLSGIVHWTLVPGVDLEVTGGAVFPFTRYVFEFRDPQAEFYTVPWVGGTGGVGLNLALP